MQGFIQRHAASVIGVLSGFDRVRLRGTLRWLSNVRGMYGFLQASSVLLKDFTRYAKGITEQIRQRTIDDAQQAGRPVIYLNSSQECKEKVAREVAERGEPSCARRPTSGISKRWLRWMTPRRWAH